jgi:hypothetical protein
MPYTLRKVANKNCYKVMNRKTKRVFAKCTTKEKAKKQIRLLNAIEYNKNFVPRGGRSKRRTYKK